MPRDGAHRLAERTAECIQYAQFDCTAQRVAVATARILAHLGRPKSLAQPDHVRPRVAIAGELLRDRSRGELLQTPTRSFPGDVAPRHTFAPADRPVGQLAAHEDVFAFDASRRRMRKAHLQRQADDRRGELADVHDGHASNYIPLLAAS